MRLSVNFSWTSIIFINFDKEEKYDSKSLCSKGEPRSDNKQSKSRLAIVSKKIEMATKFIEYSKSEKPQT